MARAITPNATSAAGLIVCLVVFVVLEFDRENTITSPSVTLVIYAPSRYPSINLAGLSSSSITVVAATSVGVSEAVSDKRTAWPAGVDPRREVRCRPVVSAGRGVSLPGGDARVPQ